VGLRAANGVRELAFVMEILEEFNEEEDYHSMSSLFMSTDGCGSLHARFIKGRLGLRTLLSSKKLGPAIQLIKTSSQTSTPKYSPLPPVFFSNCGHCTKNRSTTCTISFPDRLNFLTRAQDSI
jgi:hypothetical protein